MEMEVAKLKLQHAALQFECDKHKNRVMELLEENSMLKTCGPPPPSSSSSRLGVPSQRLDHETWAYGKVASIPCSDARVCAIALRGDLLAVGTKLTRDTHGLVQVSLLDTHHRATIPLHRLAIRDVAIRNDSKYIATTAMDGKLHVTSPSAQQSILHFDMPERHGWSCCWDVSNAHQLWVGHQNGTLSRFDMRKPGTDVLETLTHQFRQPVHAVRSLGLESNISVVVAATFSGVSIWGASDTAQPLVHHMHMDIKNCCAMANNPRCPSQLVVSTRTAATTNTTASTTTTSPAQHFVVSLRINQDDMLVETDADGVLQGHSTPSALTRSAIWSKFDGASKKDSPVVGSGDVGAHEVKVWDVATSSVVHHFDAPQPVVDIQHGWVLPTNDAMPTGGFLAVLTNDDLALYKASIHAK
ncbi:hypothetical protein, variant [Aphanomyces invadans]|nr:hypothetical protein, variant [Aphanomyces invadans]ETV99812.1 hypothetical protein, variant [Aphanomyces invadans]|eukprot:XP_008871588.1 hypothetical protein, variant [Aphanomyces invadans]